MLNAGGDRIETGDPLAFFVDAVKRGKIGAMKGLGGFHLVCQADDEGVVGELRRRKHRDEKPFGRDGPRSRNGPPDSARSIRKKRPCLLSRRRPIVLLRKRASAAEICESVAPGKSASRRDAAVHAPPSSAYASGRRRRALGHDQRQSVGRADPLHLVDDDAVERLRGIA